MKEEQSSIGIPEACKAVKIGDCARTEKGKKPKFISKEQTEEFSIPYVNIKAFEQNIIDEYTNGVGCVLCDDDDFLMVWDGSRSSYVGKSIKKALGNTLVRIKLPEVDYDFAYYFLQSKFVEINSRAKVVGIPHVGPSLVWNYNLPLLPKETQQKIVSKIEELFVKLDKGIEELKTAQQQLKVYRQAVLKWAFEKSEESSPYKLAEVCEFVTKGTILAKNHLNQNEGDIPFLKVYNLTFDGSADFTKEPTFVTKEMSNGFLKGSQVYSGDVLMNIVDPPLGKVSIVPSTYPEWNINQAIVRFRCKEGLLNKYLLHFLLSENTIRTYSRKAKAKATAGQFNLTLEICREIEIPIPSIEEQHQIVQKIESSLSFCDKIWETIANSLKQAEALRQSVLKKALEVNFFQKMRV